MNPVLEKLICETASWCFSHCVVPGNLDEQTRSDALCPDALLECPEGSRLRTLCASYNVFDAAISQVIQRRRRQIELEKLKIPDLSYCKFTGRIYCVSISPKLDVEDLDAAEDVSWGFFDLVALPGWDTWISLQESNDGKWQLCGWVPNEIATPIGIGMSWLRHLPAEWLPEAPAIGR